MGDVLKTVAPIAISLAALAVSLASYRGSRPHWHVTLQLVTVVGDERLLPSLKVTAVNVGRAAGSVQSVAVRTTDRTFHTSHAAMSAPVGGAPDLPVTVAPTEVRTWFFDYGRITTDLDRQARDLAPMLVAVVVSGLTTVESDPPLRIGLLPEPPERYLWIPGRVRRVLSAIASRVRGKRPHRAQLVPYFTVNRDALARGEWTIEVQNYGRGTAKNLRIDMVKERDGKQEVVADVEPRYVRRLNAGQNHAVLYPLSQATRRAEPGAEYWWRLHVDGIPTAARIGVMSPETLEEIRLTRDSAPKPSATGGIVGVQPHRDAPNQRP